MLIPFEIASVTNVVRKQWKSYREAENLPNLRFVCVTFAMAASVATPGSRIRRTNKIPAAVSASLNNPHTSFRESPVSLTIFRHDVPDAYSERTASIRSRFSGIIVCFRTAAETTSKTSGNDRLGFSSATSLVASANVAANIFLTR